MKLRSLFVLWSISLAALAVAALPQSAHAQAVTVTTLANFDGTNGASPYAALTLARDRNFYGTTNGNPNNSSEAGTVFKLTPAGSLTTLFSFTDTNGSFPNGKLPNGLIQASNLRDHARRGADHAPSVRHFLWRWTWRLWGRSQSQWGHSGPGR